MEIFKNFALTLTVGFLICTAFEIFIPYGKMTKIMHLILSLFTVCLIIYPIKSFIYNLKSDFKNIFDFKKNFHLKNNIENKVLDLTSENAKVVVTSILNEYEAEAKKIEIFMDNNKNGSIVITRCKIYLEKRYMNKSFEIENKIREKLGINTEIVEV